MLFNFEKTVSVRLRSSKSVRIGIGMNRFKVNRSIPSRCKMVTGRNLGIHKLVTGRKYGAQKWFL